MSEEFFNQLKGSKLIRVYSNGYKIYQIFTSDYRQNQVVSIDEGLFVSGCYVVMKNSKEGHFLTPDIKSYWYSFHNEPDGNQILKYIEENKILFENAVKEDANHAIKFVLNNWKKYEGQH